jgi:hypothetical protein
MAERCVPCGTDDNINLMFPAILIDKSFRGDSLHFFVESCDVWKGQGFQETITWLVM